MHTREEAADHRERGKQKDRRRNEAARHGATDARGKPHLRRWHHRQHKKRGGGGIRDLENPLDQHGAVIDRHGLKKEICREHQNIKAAEKEKIPIHPAKALSPDPLRKPEDRKAEHERHGHKSRKIRDDIKRHVHAEEAMHRTVQKSEAHLRALRPDGAHVDK